jgi:soluble lytic murein transglycosylase
MASKQAWFAFVTGRGLQATAVAGMGAVVVGAALILAFPLHGGRGNPSTPTLVGVSATEAASTEGSGPAASPSPPADLEVARQALREGRFEDAVAAYTAMAASVKDPEVRVECLLGAAVARFEAGDRAGSIAALRDANAIAPSGSLAGRQAAYLLGVRLNEDGLFGEAVAVLRPHFGLDDALAPYVAAAYARAAAGSGDTSAAASAWEAALVLGADDDVLRAEVYEQRADAATAAGDSATAERWLLALANLRGDAPTRYRVALLAQSLGDEATFAAQLRSIVAGAANSDEAVLAIGDLRKAGYSVDAGQEGLVYYRHGAYAEARRVLGEAVREPAIRPADLAFRYYYLAAANEDSGNTATAVEQYDIAASQDPESPYTHRAKYWAARVTETRGDARSAAARYLALAVDGPSGEFSAEARFRAGYCLLRAGDAAGAAAAWDSPGVVQDSRVLYWLGRARQELGDAAGAAVAFQAAFSIGPMDFYGIEAGRELGQEGPLEVGYRPLPAVGPPDWGAIAAWLGIAPGSTAGAASPTAAGDLIAVGLRAQARAVFLAEAEGVSQATLLNLTREAYEDGLPDVVVILAESLRPHAGVSAGTAPRSFESLLYPADYVLLLDSEAEQSGIDPLFLAALIRQESLWDPSAESRAGALGLTQVIPPTGEGIARALGMPFEVPDLLRPAVSIRFGAYYLGGELRRFGTPFAALAAYNSGPGSIARWTAGAGSGRAADFVEAIDIDETKHYVEQVLEHYAHYRRAYGG